MKNLMKNGVASLLRKVVRALEQLLLVPFFISAWGTAYYGEWITLTMIPSVIAISDFGLGSAVANSFVLIYASGNHKRAANINKTGLNMVTFIILLLIMIGIIAILILNKFNVFDNLLIEKDVAIFSISILTLARIFSFYSQIYQSYYTSARKAALGLNIFALKTFVNLVVGLIVLYLGLGVIEFSISQLIVEISYLFINRIIARNVLGFFENNKGKFDKSEFKFLYKKGLGYLMNPIWRVIYFQGTTFVVRLVLGPVSVTIFNTVRTFSRSINQLFSVINAAVLPEMQYAIGSGNMYNAKKLYRISMLIVSTIAISSFFFLMIFGLNIYEIWTKNELNVSNFVWFTFVLSILFNSLWITSSVVYRAVNDPFKIIFYGVVSALISVVISYFLSINFGLEGAAVGSLLFDIILAFLILPNTCKLLEMSFIDIFKYGKSDIKEIFLKLKQNYLK